MKKILLIIISFLGLVSCNNFLDLKPHDKVVPETSEDYSTLLNNMLYNIEYGITYTIMDNTTNIMRNEACVDDLDLNIYLGSTSLPIYIGSYINNRSSDYSSIYNVISNCNIILNNLENDVSELGQKVRATAYAIRGICHYNILRQFCEPVVNGTYPSLGIVCVDEFNIEAKLVRKSYRESIQFIENDFNQALTLKMNDATYMFTEDVVNAFRTRLFFWTQQWEKAIEVGKALLLKYPLLSGESYLEMFSSKLPKGNVIIKSNHYTNSGQIMSEKNEMEMLQKRPVNKTLIDAFDQPDKDIRFRMMMDSKRIVQKNAFPCIRAAEIALIIAESHFHLGEEKEALAAINELRRNRISSYSDLKMEELRPISTNNIIKVDAKGNPLTPLSSLILNERRIELFMEGDRLFERKRNGMPETWVAYNGRAYINEKYMYTFPLPYQDIRLVNGLIQNPGYDVIREK